MKLLNCQEVKELLERDGHAWIKYVRLPNEFRFADADPITSLNHKDMVTDEEKEQVVSAAYLSIREDGIKVTGDAMSLKKFSAPDDTQLLSELFNLPCEKEY